jgi:putative membrane protein
VSTTAILARPSPAISDDAAGAVAPPTPEPAASGSTTSRPAPTARADEREDTTASLSDGQSAELAREANSETIDEGLYAAAQASDERVKHFARRFAATQQELNQRLLELARKLNVLPTVSRRSAQMVTDAQARLEAFKAQTGADFDRAYLDAQIKVLKDSLNMFDAKLIPNARNEDLRKDLRAARARLAERLSEAQSIRRSLGASAPTGSP